MYGNHVIKDLSAYCHGEMSLEDSQRVAAHLLVCQRCRKEYEEIKLGIRLAEQLPRISAPESLWNNIESSLAKQPVQVAQWPSRSRFTFFTGWYRLAAVSATLLLVLGIGAAWYYMRSSGPTWEVASLEGTPKVGSDRIRETGRLAVGEWLETDEASRAKIRVANIGHVEVDPATRIRLVETRLTEHRLELARGRMHARIWAPPRLFFVDTPSAVAADLGCAYTLEVDDRGRSRLHVTSGWVALELKDRESIVPAGAACLTQPGIGPGTPFFEDASETFLNALTKFDFEGGGAGSLNTLLAQSRPRDTLTLWHLLARVDEQNRGRVFNRIVEFAPLPEGVTREGIMRLDREMLELWKDQLETIWSHESVRGLRKAWRQLWSDSPAPGVPKKLDLR